jgi:hypothetical protein
VIAFDAEALAPASALAALLATADASIKAGGSGIRPAEVLFAVVVVVVIIITSIFFLWRGGSQRYPYDPPLFF